MTSARRAALLAVLVLGCGVVPSAAQDIAVRAPATRTVLNEQEMKNFLLHARIGGTKGVNKGVTDARRVSLSDGNVTHDAQIQDVDIFKPIFQLGKATEVNSIDSYRYNIAAYRLSRLLGLDSMPISVMIDHTRAFRLGLALQSPALPDRCERTLLDRMRGLTVADAMGDILRKPEIDALLTRRDAIVKLFDDRIAQRGEAAVLYSMPR